MNNKKIKSVIAMLTGMALASGSQAELIQLESGFTGQLESGWEGLTYGDQWQSLYHSLPESLFGVFGVLDRGVNAWSMFSKANLKLVKTAMSEKPAAIKTLFTQIIEAVYGAIIDPNSVTFTERGVSIYIETCESCKTGKFSLSFVQSWPSGRDIIFIRSTTHPLKPSIDTAELLRLVFSASNVGIPTLRKCLAGIEGLDLQTGARGSGTIDFPLDFNNFGLGADIPVGGETVRTNFRFSLSEMGLSFGSEHIEDRPGGHFLPELVERALTDQTQNAPAQMAITDTAPEVVETAQVEMGGSPQVSDGTEGQKQCCCATM